MLLADYLKGLLTGELLPDDLAAQAAGSPLLRAVPLHRDVPRAPRLATRLRSRLRKHRRRLLLLQLQL